MKIVGCILDGFEVVGFMVENNKGSIKKASYKNALSSIKKNKFENLTCKTIDGHDIIVGLNYQELTMLNLKEVDMRIENDKVYVGDEEVSDKDLWNVCLNAKNENIDIGLDLVSGGLKVLDIKN